MAFLCVNACNAEPDSHKGFCFEKMKKIENLEIYSLSSFPGKEQQSVSDFVYVENYETITSEKTVDKVLALNHF